MLPHIIDIVINRSLVGPAYLPDCQFTVFIKWAIQGLFSFDFSHFQTTDAIFTTI